MYIPVQRLDLLVSACQGLSQLQDVLLPAAVASAEQQTVDVQQEGDLQDLQVALPLAWATEGRFEPCPVLACA